MTSTPKTQKGMYKWLNFRKICTYTYILTTIYFFD